MPETWTALVWKHFHARNLTRAYRDVLLTLETFRGHGGAIWPSHDTLAGRSGCVAKTVQRALAIGRELGLVDWSERRIKRGWRWLRTSNSYRLTQPDEPVRPSLHRPRATNGQRGRGGESLKKEGRKAALEAMKREAASVGDLLAARQTAMERVIRAAWEGRRAC